MGGLHQAEVEADEWGAAGAPEQRRQARLRCLLPQRELLPRSAPIFLNKLSTIHTATASRPASGIRTATVFLPAPLGPFRGQRCLCEDVFSVVQAEARRPGQHIERLMTTTPRLDCSVFASSPHDFKRKAAIRCRHPHICHRPLSLPCSCSPTATAGSAGCPSDGDGQNGDLVFVFHEPENHALRSASRKQRFENNVYLITSNFVSVLIILVSP